MERRKFTREFKLEAVRLIKDRGVSYAQAGRDLGVHQSQLRVVPTEDVEIGNLHELTGKYPSVAADIRAIAASVQHVAPSGVGPR